MRGFNRGVRFDENRSPNPRGGRWRGQWRKKRRRDEREPRRRQKPPTVKQVYALAAALCTFTGQEFPRTREEATDLIERIRIDIGHPEPSLPPRD